MAKKKTGIPGLSFSPSLERKVGRAVLDLIEGKNK